MEQFTYKGVWVYTFISVVSAKGIKIKTDMSDNKKKPLHSFKFLKVNYKLAENDFVKCMTLINSIRRNVEIPQKPGFSTSAAIKK